MVNLKDFWLNFIIVFVGLYVFFLALDFWLLRVLVATASASLLKILGTTVLLSGTTILFNSTSYIVVSSCTGVVGFSLFTALITAAPFKRKEPYIIAAFPLFIAWNIVRVSATVLWADLHFWLWTATVFLVLALFNWVAKKEKLKL